MTSAESRTRAVPGIVAQYAHAVLHCNLNTGDLDRSVAFHRSAFDLGERMRSANPDDDGTPMGLGPHTSSVTSFLYDHRGPRAAPAIELVGWQEPFVSPRDSRSTGPAALGFRVVDLAAASQAVRVAGGAVTASADGLLVRGRLLPAVTTTDPNGVSIEIVEIDTGDDREAPAVSHERLRCADLDASLAWYSAIGWVVGARSADGSAASLVLPEDPTFSLELEHHPELSPRRPSTATTQGLYRMALAVEDVRAAHGALRTRIDGDLPDPWFFAMPDVPTGGFTALFLADPDGVVVELVERPRSAVRRPTEPR